MSGCVCVRVYSFERSLVQTDLSSVLSAREMAGFRTALLHAWLLLQQNETMETQKLKTQTRRCRTGFLPPHTNMRRNQKRMLGDSSIIYTDFFNMEEISGPEVFPRALAPSLTRSLTPLRTSLVSSLAPSLVSSLTHSLPPSL